MCVWGGCLNTFRVSDFGWNEDVNSLCVRVIELGINRTSCEHSQSRDNPCKEPQSHSKNNLKNTF